MKQFDFARNWKRKVVPLLAAPTVERVLHLGMMLQHGNYKSDTPPWRYGWRLESKRKARPGCLSWYQPWGHCHSIAPFSWAIGRELYPELKWGFINSNAHTVAIGYRNNWRRPEVVMDILLFKEMTAKESLAFAKGHGWRFYRSFSHFAASHLFGDETASSRTIFENLPTASQPLFDAMLEAMTSVIAENEREGRYDQ